MSATSATTNGVNFGRLRLFIVFLAVLAFFLGFSQTVYADITDCFRSVKKNRQIDGKEYTVLVFNTTQKCDLHRTIRLFPQLNTTTQEQLSDQEQLRSIYAANQKVKVGDRELATVLRGCVPNSKPWPDQTAEERDFCPGLVNYYQNGFGGPVLIPHTRQLSRGEKLESAFSKACAIINAQPSKSEQEKEVLNDCQQLITGFILASSVDKAIEIVTPDEASSVSEGKDNSAVYLKQIDGLKNQVATLEAKAQKGVWLWPLFSLMVGFAIFGASGTIFGITERRIRKEEEMRHKLFVQGSREVVIKSTNSSVSQKDMEERSRKIEKRLREELENEYRERIKRERLDSEKQIEAKYGGISANLAKKNLNLEQALEKARDELITASETVTKELRLKITHLTEECDKERSKANDSQVEAEALKQELGNAERKHKQSSDELELLKDRFAESELEIKTLEQLNLELKQEAEEFAVKAKSAEAALHALEQRHVELLAAQDVLSNAAKDLRKSDHRKTLPIGAAPTETLGMGPEDSTYSMVLERGKIRDDQYDEKDQENISSSRFGSVKTEGDEGGAARDPITTEMDELRPSQGSKNSMDEEKTFTEFRLDRDPDDGQESAEIIPRTSHESHTACKAGQPSSEKEDDEKARDAS